MPLCSHVYIMEALTKSFSVRHMVVTTTEFCSPSETLFILLYIAYLLFLFVFFIYQDSKKGFNGIEPKNSQKEINKYPKQIRGTSLYISKISFKFTALHKMTKSCIMCECNTADVCSGGV